MNSVKNLDNLKIRRILKAHNVPCYIKGGRIYADTMESGKSLFESVEDLTGFDLDELREWLGY